MPPILMKSRALLLSIHLFSRELFIFTVVVFVFCMFLTIMLLYFSLSLPLSLFLPPLCVCFSFVCYSSFFYSSLSPSIFYVVCYLCFYISLSIISAFSISAYACIFVIPSLFLFYYQCCCLLPSFIISAVLSSALCVLFCENESLTLHNAFNSISMLTTYRSILIYSGIYPTDSYLMLHHYLFLPSAVCVRIFRQRMQSISCLYLLSL